MSLLLDALKKSGMTAPRSTSPSAIHLADADAPASPLPCSCRTSSTRTDRQHIFFAKIVPGNIFRHWGIIPITLLCGVLLAAGTGYYIHREIAPRVPPPSGNVSVQPTAPRAPLVAQQKMAALTPTVAPPTSSLGIAPHATNTPKTIQKKPASRIARKPHTDKEAPNIRHQTATNLIDPMLASAYGAYQQGDYSTAWLHYREALILAPNNRDALLGLAVIAQQQGKNDAAVHYYRQVLRLDPRDPIAHAGLSAFGSGDAADKETRLKQLISQQPDSAALYFALGHQYAEQLRWSDAQQAYFNALTMEPDNALFAFNLAISLDHLGQHKAAAQYYQQALQFDTAGHTRFNFALARQRLNEISVPEN